VMGTTIEGSEQGPSQATCAQLWRLKRSIFRGGGLETDP
jgi:hypothetical protein